ncbi:MAG: hypothetical protein ACLP01_05240 [Solirubrobacteraceae bacterium]
MDRATAPTRLGRIYWILVLLVLPVGNLVLTWALDSSATLGAFARFLLAAAAALALVEGVLLLGSVLRARSLYSHVRLVKSILLLYAMSVVWAVLIYLTLAFLFVVACRLTICTDMTGALAP